MIFRTTHTNRFLVTLLAYSLIAAQTVQISYAATDLSDIPLAVRNQAKPNIMFMVDNSGSMSNIVPDSAPTYIDSATYLTSCTTPIDGGVATALTAATEIYDTAIKTDGTVRILQRNASYGNPPLATITYGTGAGERCFNPTKFYYARLNANSAGTSNNSNNCGTNTNCNFPDGYLAAVYSGHYLNWYFGQSSAYTSAANFGASAKRKPGTTSRIEIAISTAKSVVDSLSNVRAGLSTYNNGDGGTLLEVIGDIDAAKKTALKGKIDLLIPGGNTPLAETLSDIGRYFTTGYNGNLKLHPGQSNAADQSVSAIFNDHSISNSSGVSTLVAPIQFFCQKSFAVLLTDGRPQADQSISTHLADYDGDCSGTNAANCTTFDRKLSQLYESAGSDYLDDVAQALFEMDLRPDLLPPAGSNITKDKNNVTTYTIGFADLQVAADPLLQDAATQGGGQRYLPKDAAALSTAFQSALEDILAKDGASAAVAVANANVTSTDNNSYASSYNSGTWTGDLQNFDINPANGIVSTTANWSAQPLLNLRTSANRYIATHNGSNGTSGTGIQFQPTSASTSTKLSSAQQTSLNTPAVPPAAAQLDGEAVVAYLRGDRSGEPATYRARTHLLGDIVNAEPVVVRAPSASYTDAGYSAFKTAQSSRARFVYQGANDGMLHAFLESNGEEEWAYIPNLVLSSLNLRTRKTSFMHRFYVDGTPTSGDVDLTFGDNGNPTPDWRTILVGGLNKGGRGYYALDITDPVLPSTNKEANLATKVLWEFPNSIANATSRATVTANMGYSYGNPVIVKTQTEGWVVLVTSGYNNGTDTGGNGQGYLYVLDAKTGDLIKSISTGVGTNSDPSGLGKISAYVEDSNLDNTATLVYGGDLKGNVWRFDLTGPQSTWNVKKLATLVDSSNNFQPVTTAPELARININGTDRFLVYVGTGQYLGDTDLTGISGITPNSNASQTQTIYGLLDDRTSSPTITGLRTGSLQQQTIISTPVVVNGVPTGAVIETASTNEITYPVEKGWYLDFPDTGERLFTDPALASGALIFTTNTPSSTTCVPGGSSKLYFLDYTTGGLLSNTSFSVVRFPDALSSRAVLIKLESGVVDALTRQSDKDTVTTNVPVPSTTSGTRRVNWREIINQ